MKSAGLGILIILFLASIAFAVEEVGGGDIVYKIKRTGDVIFRHDTHVTDYGFDCENCHDVIYPLPREEGKKHTMAEMRRHKACGVCHDGKNAFDTGENCYLCHIK